MILHLIAYRQGDTAAKHLQESVSPTVQIHTQGANPVMGRVRFWNKKEVQSYFKICLFGWSAEGVLTLILRSSVGSNCCHGSNQTFRLSRESFTTLRYCLSSQISQGRSMRSYCLWQSLNQPSRVIGVAVFYGVNCFGFNACRRQDAFMSIK